MKKHLRWLIPVGGLVVIFAVVGVFLVINNGGKTPPITDGGGLQPPTTTSSLEDLTVETPVTFAKPKAPTPLPDLMISGILVYPVQPKAGQYFTVQVYVKNAGQVPSGEFDLKISIKDVSRNFEYPGGTFLCKGLQPGEDTPVYISQDRRVDYPGEHQVWTEVVPFTEGPRDSNPQNNTFGWAFTVVQ